MLADSVHVETSFSRDDDDSLRRSRKDGGPPKITTLDAGNAGTDDIATQLRSELRSVERLLADAAAALLILHL